MKLEDHPMSRDEGLINPVPVEDRTAADRNAEFADYLNRAERFSKRTRRELRRTAYHEAGHAVLRLHRGLTFDWVAVRPLPPELDWTVEEAMGPFDFGMVYSEERLSHRDLEDYWHDRLISTLAGPAAEARLVGVSRWRLVGQDREMADECLVASRAGDERMERDYRVLAGLLVERHWLEIDAVAGALVQHRYLDFRQVRRIARQARLATQQAP